MARSVQVKTLKGESFHIEVAPEAVMSDVKAIILEQRGVDPASQVLICGGKTLKDGDALSASVAAGGFLVLMVKAKRRATPVATKPSSSAAAAAAGSSSSSSSAAPAAATAAPSPPTASTSATPAAAAATTAAAAPPAAATTAAAPAPAAAASASTTTEAVGGAGAVAAGNAAAGEELAIDPASVEMLTAMGFPEDKARAALRAAFNDVSRAASYLMEGIPEGVAGAAEAAGGGGTPSDARDGGDEEGEDDVPLRLGVEGRGNPLNFMRFHPQFDQLRGLVRENPAVLPQVLQQLGAQSPELVDRINEHPGDFLRLMNEPPDVEGQAMMEMGIEGLMDGMEQEDDDEADAAAAGFAAVGGEGGRGQGQQVTVELTEEEEAAVQNLMAMVPGVGRDQVIEAFIACDKNAELAANLLFENAF